MKEHLLKSSSCVLLWRPCQQRCISIMAVSEEGKTELSEPQVCMVEMAALLRARAPNLGPNVTPRPFKSVVRNILELCSTAQQRADAEAYLSSRAAAEKARASSDFDDECGDKGDEGKVDHKTEMHVVVKTETDVSTTTFRIISCEVRGEGWDQGVKTTAV